MAGTFSVPARRLRSWRPPVSTLASLRSPANPERADAFRPAELVAGEREQVDAQRAHVHRDLADRLDRVGVQTAPRSRARPASSATGWMTPVSLFAVMIDTSATSGPSASRSAAGRHEAVGVDRQDRHGGAAARRAPRPC